jgi:hypothetical protein
MSSGTPYGYDIDELDAPKFLSRGEWNLTGTEEIDAWQPLKSSTTLSSGLFGQSGLYEVYQWATKYDDISGISGCIGVNIRKLSKATDTGLRNQNIGLRKMAVLHEGYCIMEYIAGTLDGTVITLKYGDVIAPATSGFRCFQELNFTLISGAIGTATLSGTFLHTGTRQCKLGWFADVVSDQTGARHRVKIMPNSIYGTTK